LPRAVIVRVGRQRRKGRKQVADALGHFRVAACSELALHRSENRGQLIEAPELRVLPANGLFGIFIAGALLTKTIGDGSAVESRARILPRVSRSGGVAHISLNDRQ